MRLFDRFRGGCAVAGRQIGAREREPDLLRGQRLLLRGRERALQPPLRALRCSARELLLGNPQERPGMVRQRRQDFIVDATRLGAPARGFVPGGERERILNGELHRYPPCLRGNVSRRIRAASEYHAR